VKGEAVERQAEQWRAFTDAITTARTKCEERIPKGDARIEPTLAVMVEGKAYVLLPREEYTFVMMA